MEVPSAWQLWIRPSGTSVTDGTYMERAESTAGRGCPTSLRDTLCELGDYATSLVDLHSLGLPRAVVHDQLTLLARDLVGLSGEIRELLGKVGPGAGLPCPLGGRGVVAWDYAQSLRYAAGAMMTMGRFRSRIPEGDVRKALLAKVMYEFAVEMLDDLIDHGDYDYREARSLLQLSLRSLIDPDLEKCGFRRELSLLLRREHHDVLDALVHLTVSFNRLFFSSPSGSDVLPYLEEETDGFVEGEALTMFQKERTLDLRGLREASAALPAPDPGLQWHERLAAFLSWVTNHTLIDMAFLEEPPSGEEIRAHRGAWYYYNVAITQVNSLGDVRHDLEEGIASIAVLAMREAEVMELRHLKGYAPDITWEEYEGQLMQTAGFFQRALCLAAGTDEGLFYPFITLMIPAVILGDRTEHGRPLIDPLLDALAPAMREACGAARPLVEIKELMVPKPQVPLPRVMDGATIPPRIRSGRRRCGRTASW